MDEQNPLNQSSSQPVTSDPFQDNPSPSVTQPVTSLPPSPWTDTEAISEGTSVTPTPQAGATSPATTSEGGSIPPVPTPPSDDMQSAQWPEPKAKSKLPQVIGGVLAVLLVVGAATGAYIVSSRVSQQQAVAPTAPESEPLAGCREGDTQCEQGVEQTCFDGIWEDTGTCAMSSSKSSSSSSRDPNSCTSPDQRCVANKWQYCSGGTWQHTSDPCGADAPPSSTSSTSSRSSSRSSSSQISSSSRTSSSSSSRSSSSSSSGSYLSGSQCSGYVGDTCAPDDHCLPNDPNCTVINDEEPHTCTQEDINAGRCHGDISCREGYYPCNGNTNCCKIAQGGSTSGGGDGIGGGGGGVGGGFECAPGTVSNGRCEKNPRLRKTQANCCTAGTPTPSTTIVAGACMEISLYAKNADGTFSTTPMTQDQKNSIKVGDVIRLVVTTSKANLKVKFKVTVGTTAPVEYAATGYLTSANTSAYYDYTVTQTGTIKFEGLVSTKP